MEDKISIVVPVYNMEQHLERCVNSLIKQTYSNLEILLIDDGSKDKSLQLCHEFARMDYRIKVFHKENGGLSDTRNFGVAKATGNYITFVDSDDDIEKNMIEVLYKIIKNNDAEVSECNMKICYPSHVQLFSQEKYVDVLDRKGYLKEYLTMHKLFGSVCTKMIQKDIAKKIFFPVGKLYEDTFYSLDLIQAANKYVICDEPLYNYYMRDGSITNSSFSERMLDLTEIIDEIYLYVQKSYPELLEEAECRKMYAYLSVFNAIIQEKEYKRNSHFRKYHRYFKANIFKLIRNPYITKARKLCVILIDINIGLYKIVLKKYIEKLNRR